LAEAAELERLAAQDAAAAEAEAELQQQQVVSDGLCMCIVSLMQ
jgi:hypothetical protein